MPKRPTVVVDFDGTIVEHAFPEIGKLKHGVVEALTELRKHFKVVISSCRNSSLFGPENRVYHEAMKAFLVAKEIPHDEVDEGDCGKVFATHYIDDRGIRFENNWPEIVKMLVP